MKHIAPLSAILVATFLAALLGMQCGTTIPGVPSTDGTSETPRIFGNGSAGARVIDVDQNLRQGGVGDVNFQYTDFTINPGVTLTIQSGLVLRCTGAFTNNGTIIIKTGASGGFNASFDAATDGTKQQPALGITNRSAGNAAIGTDTLARAAGLAGDGISEFEARVTLAAGVRAGGGGGAGMAVGGEGGGSFTVLAMSSIVNNGTILATGGDGNAGDADPMGDGGGGGGFVLLASKGSVTNAAGALIDVRGGPGAPAGACAGPGGGGGGGIVHLISPTIINDGTVLMDGGAPGANGAPGSVTTVIRAGGGGGGASGGSGGTGGMVTSGATATPMPAQAGHTGFSLQTAVDPTSLF